MYIKIYTLSYVFIYTICAYKKYIHCHMHLYSIYNKPLYLYNIYTGKIIYTLYILFLFYIQHIYRYILYIWGSVYMLYISAPKFPDVRSLGISVESNSISRAPADDDTEANVNIAITPQSPAVGLDCCFPRGRTPCRPGINASPSRARL